MVLPRTLLDIETVNKHELAKYPPEIICQQARIWLQALCIQVANLGPLLRFDIDDFTGEVYVRDNEPIRLLVEEINRAIDVTFQFDPTFQDSSYAFGEEVSNDTTDG